MAQWLTNFFGLEYYREKVPSLYKIGGLLGLAFLLSKMNCLFFWNSYKAVLMVGISLFVILFSIYLINFKKIHFTGPNSLFAITTILICFLFWSVSDKNIFGILSTIFSIVAVFFLVLWDWRILKIVYKYLFRLIVFISFFSIIISLLGGMSLLDRLPHYIMPPAESLHEEKGIEYYVYGVCVTLHYPIFNTLIPRACGILCEPGHYAILIGIIYTIERLQKHKINIPILVCGLLTFSSTFFLIAGFTELVLLFKFKLLSKYLKYILISIFLSILTFSLLPHKIQDDIYYLFLDRNLSAVITSYNQSQSLNDALDERINDAGKRKYEVFLRNGDWLFGEGTLGEGVTLSDYRNILIRRGILGIILTLIEIWCCVRGLKGYKKWAMLFPLIVIFLHRAWMFFMVYQFLIIFIGKLILENNTSYTIRTICSVNK